MRIQAIFFVSVQSQVGSSGRLEKILSRPPRGVFRLVGDLVVQIAGASGLVGASEAGRSSD